MLRGGIEGDGGDIPRAARLGDGGSGCSMSVGKSSAEAARECVHPSVGWSSGMSPTKIVSLTMARSTLASNGSTVVLKLFSPFEAELILSIIAPQSD